VADLAEFFCCGLGALGEFSQLPFRGFGGIAAINGPAASRRRKAGLKMAAQAAKDKQKENV
jgi:hypothetical protein